MQRCPLVPVSPSVQGGAPRGPGLIAAAQVKKFERALDELMGAGIAVPGAKAAEAAQQEAIANAAIAEKAAADAAASVKKAEAAVAAEKVETAKAMVAADAKAADEKKAKAAAALAAKAKATAAAEAKAKAKAKATAAADEKAAKAKAEAEVAKAAAKSKAKAEAELAKANAGAEAAKAEVFCEDEELFDDAGEEPSGKDAVEVTCLRHSPAPVLQQHSTALRFLCCPRIRG